MTTDTARFSSSPFSCIVLLSVSQYQYVEENSGEAAARWKKEEG